VPLTLRELLDFDVMLDAQPDVLVGGSGLDRPVRWVHSSEIFEIGPLLFGGELLLTTGLGLAGSDAGARRHYIRELATRDVTGLALEVGRTFPTVPGELVEEARRTGLPLIVLNAVVPFIRIAEAANTAIVDGAAARLRLGDEVTRALNETLIAGAGVAGLLATAGALTRCPLIVVSTGGALVAGHGVRDERDAWALVDEARDEVPVNLQGQAWGRLLAGPGSVLADADLATTLERTAAALALAVLLTGNPPSQRTRHAAALLADLVDGPTPADADYTLRAGLAGFHPDAGQRVVAVAMDCPETGSALAVVDRAARALGTPRLAGRVVGSVLGLLAVPRDPTDAVGAAEAAVEEARRRSGATGLTAALGHAVAASEGPGEVAASLRDARAALRLAVAERATRPNHAPSVVTTRALALELQLLASADRGRLAAMAHRTVGVLAEWDRTHRTELIWTLEVLLRNGGSPTRTAAALHLGRQSLYQRIERIEALLGHRVDDPMLHASLLLAACAHRISR